jgi:sensor histidine kinase regulating citrate/malate metabolism
MIMLRHDLRRTVFCTLVHSGVSELVAMIIAAHTTRSVFDRYHDVSPGDIQKAAQKLAAMLSGLSQAVLPLPLDLQLR